MIEIDKSHLIGKGNTRNVFLHPDDPAKLIKVFRQNCTPDEIRHRKMWNMLLPASSFDANRRDYVYHTRYRDRSPTLCAHICEVFGYVDTNLGPGIEVERILNHDATPSLTLSQHIASGKPETLSKPLEALFELLGQHHVLLRDEGSGNFMVRHKEQGFELVIVDGLGEPNVIPYASVSKFLNRTKLERKLVRLLASLERSTSRYKAKALKNIKNAANP